MGSNLSTRDPAIPRSIASFSPLFRHIYLEDQRAPLTNDHSDCWGLSLLDVKPDTVSRNPNKSPPTDRFLS